MTTVGWTLVHSWRSDISDDYCWLYEALIPRTWAYLQKVLHPNDERCTMKSWIPGASSDFKEPVGVMGCCLEMSTALISADWITGGCIRNQLYHQLNSLPFPFSSCCLMILMLVDMCFPEIYWVNGCWCYWITLTRLNIDVVGFLNQSHAIYSFHMKQIVIISIIPNAYIYSYIHIYI